MTQGAARYTTRYTDTQKDAIVKNVVLNGETVAESVRKASRGELGMAAFSLNLQYAYEVVNARREAFEGENDEVLRRVTAKALKQAHAANLKALRALHADADPAERARLAKAVSSTWQAMSTLGKAPGRPKTEAPAQEPVAPQRGPDVLDSLLELAPKGKAT